MRTSGPAALCLDLTRLISRIGQGPWTGVDRVEAAYLRWLIGLEDRPVFGLVRRRLGYALYDRDGLVAVEARLSGRVPWNDPREWWRIAGENWAIDRTLGRLSFTNCKRFRLKSTLVDRFKMPTNYLNVGHSNLTERIFRSWGELEQGRIVTLVHDLIPLMHPEFQRPEIPPRFERRMRRVAARADLVLCPSAATASEVRTRFTAWGRCPPVEVMPLGAPPADPVPAEVPEGLWSEGPYFVCLGTIEPRKNHALLLDLWADMAREGPPPPPLLLIGRRGWENRDVFARLDAGVPGVREASGLSDGAVAALVQGAAGLLFPSWAEGYGLPALEAAALGCPVVCADLPIFRETMGDAAVYAGPNALYLWKKQVRALAAARMSGASRPVRAAPGWEAHFNGVLSLM